MKKKKAFLLAAVYCLITQLRAQDVVDGYIVRNDPIHDFTANISIDPVSILLEPGNGALGCAFGFQTRIKNKFSVEGKLFQPYFNFINYADRFDASSTFNGNSVKEESPVRGWDLCGTYHFGGQQKLDGGALILKGNSHINYSVYLDDQVIYSMKGLRLGVGGYRSWFNTGAQDSGNHVPVFIGHQANNPGVQTDFSSSTSLGNNVHSTFLNIGISRIKVTDIIYHVKKLKINGKSYFNLKDRRDNSEAELFFDMLINLKTYYDDMDINGYGVYIMDTPSRNLGFRMGWTQRYYNNGYGGIAIGLYPGLYTDQVFDNIYFNLFFGVNLTKLKT